LEFPSSSIGKNRKKECQVALLGSIFDRQFERFRHRRVCSSPLTGRSSDDLTEASIERWLICETYFQCNLKQRPIGVQQQRLRGLNSSMEQVSTNRNSEGLLEGAHKATW
jgi:hypothetical protein